MKIPLPTGKLTLNPTTTLPCILASCSHSSCVISGYVPIEAFSFIPICSTSVKASHALMGVATDHCEVFKVYMVWLTNKLTSCQWLQKLPFFLKYYESLCEELVNKVLRKMF